MKKGLLISWALFSLSTIHSRMTNQEKIDLAQRQYQTAMERVFDESPAFMRCLENKQCDLREMQDLKHSLSTNLGTMKAALTTITGRIRGKKLSDLVGK